MKWKKLGLIIQPRKDMAWMRTHAMVPTADHNQGDIYRIYFSGRDDLNRSLVGYADIDITNPGKILKIADKPVLELGELGCFDDNGVTPSWIVNHEGKKYLYYIGWRPRSTTRMSVIAGLAVSIDGGLNFKRVSRAPILRLTDKEPFSILTAPCVLKEGFTWRMWYVSGFEWANPDLPRYNIKYAESKDGLLWEQRAIVCIDSSAKEETALARPCVLKENGKYKMWYSYKKEGSTYRIGYAESDNGIDWMRMDERVGIDVSESGWDSEMIEYAFVFKHQGNRYMLYNGNGYGTNGIGLAVQVQK
jgi:hypothetical protein